MKTFIIVAGLVCLLVAAAAIALFQWFKFDEVQMSGHGYVAMGLGVGFSLLLGVGLMALVFYSNRHGYDDDPQLPPSED